MIEALTHGPGVHEIAIGVLTGIAAIVGVLYAVGSRRRTARRSERDQGEA